MLYGYKMAALMTLVGTATKVVLNVTKRKKEEEKEMEKKKRRLFGEKIKEFFCWFEKTAEEQGWDLNISDPKNVIIDGKTAQFNFKLNDSNELEFEIESDDLLIDMFKDILEAESEMEILHVSDSTAAVA